METPYITPQKLFAHRFRDGNPMPTWDMAVICFRDLRGSEALLSAFGAQPIPYKVLWGYEPSVGGNVFEAQTGWAKVGIIPRAGWGGQQTAIIVEELAAMGVKYLLGFGAAGSIDADLPQGTQIVVRSAPLTDGTSRNYASETVHCDSRLQSTLPNVRAVTAATVDAVYRETESLIKSFQRVGAQIINMESAPFYAAAQCCNVPALWVGHVSDELFGSWKDWHVDRNAMTAQTIANVASAIEGIPAAFK
jgi:uridine phosphorylase